MSVRKFVQNWTGFFYYYMKQLAANGLSALHFHTWLSSLSGDFSLDETKRPFVVPTMTLLPWCTSCVTLKCHKKWSRYMMLLFGEVWQKIYLKANTTGFFFMLNHWNQLMLHAIETYSCHKAEAVCLAHVCGWGKYNTSIHGIYDTLYPNSIMQYFLLLELPNTIISLPQWLY